MKNIWTIFCAVLCYVSLSVVTFAEGSLLDHMLPNVKQWPVNNTITEGLYKWTVQAEGVYEWTIKDDRNRATTIDIYDAEHVNFASFTTTAEDGNLQSTAHRILLKKGTYYVALQFDPTGSASVQKVSDSYSDLEPNSRLLMRIKCR